MSSGSGTRAPRCPRAWARSRSARRTAPAARSRGRAGAPAAASQRPKGPGSAPPLLRAWPGGEPRARLCAWCPPWRHRPAAATGRWRPSRPAAAPGSRGTKRPART
eukprot:8815910-Lingulodinium_polyedra.AAC.1